jgi:heat-inducible transcriptional repressor
MDDTRTFELTVRQEQILKCVVSEHLATARPVASELLAQRYGLGVSSATVRNDMAILEQWGYVYHPHTSAGRVPSDRGYRLFVERLMDTSELSATESRRIDDQFHQVKVEPDQWVRLAASVIARATQNAAIASLPLTRASRLKDIELLPVQEQSVLMIAVAHGSLVRHQIIDLVEQIGEDELRRKARRLSINYRGLTATEIGASALELDQTEQLVTDHLVKLLRQTDTHSFASYWYDGIVHIIDQPEFSDVSRLKAIVELLEDRTCLTAVVAEVVAGDGVRVFIGEENPNPRLRRCTVILAQYGRDTEGSGILSVVGPTRLDYARAISTVQYVSEIMSELYADVYG